MSDLISRHDAMRVYQDVCSHVTCKECSMYNGDGEICRIEEWLKALPSAPPEQQRTFVELVVEYPDPELCTYKEYKGKPYYSIKYIENGEIHIGYGTYNPKVLSQYLKEYFISSAQPDRKKGKWIIPVPHGDVISYSRAYWECDQCHEVAYFGNEMNFCPNCGADMRGEQE